MVAKLVFDEEVNVDNEIQIASFTIDEKDFLVRISLDDIEKMRIEARRRVLNPSLEELNEKLIKDEKEFNYTKKKIDELTITPVILENVKGALNAQVVDVQDRINKKL
ncbi:hypothetical protein HY745_08385 [Candidatus Desantisbacteria bacterium]|nr:hypothetical protein [Candidatus Desantisbacteria bacterium]